MNNKREAKLWSSESVSLFIRSLNFCVLKIMLLRTKARLWGVQKLKTLRSYDNSIWSKRNLRHSKTDRIRTNVWRTIYFKALSHPQEGIFVDTTLILSTSGAHLRIVLLYYYYSKWMSDNSNSKVVELDFFTKDGRLQLSQLYDEFQAGTLSLCNGHHLPSSINRRLKWKKRLLYYYCV